jgi:hypothetical protein
VARVEDDKAPHRDEIDEFLSHPNPKQGNGQAAPPDALPVRDSG